MYICTRISSSSKHRSDLVLYQRAARGLEDFEKALEDLGARAECILCPRAALPRPLEYVVPLKWIEYCFGYAMIRSPYTPYVPIFYVIAKDCTSLFHASKHLVKVRSVAGLCASKILPRKIHVAQMTWGEPACLQGPFRTVCYSSFHFLFHYSL